MASTDVDQEVRAKLFLVMTGLLPLRDFQVWFAPVAWRLTSSSAPHTFVRRVELLLAEYTNGDWTQAAVLRELDALLNPRGTNVTFAIGQGNWGDSYSPVTVDWYKGSETTTEPKS